MNRLISALQVNDVVIGGGNAKNLKRNERIRYLQSGIADVARVRSNPSKQNPVEAVTSVSVVSD